jgi:hypothetical protein
MSASYPLHLDARLDAPLSRWRWAVKWLLAIPHYIILAFLWVAFTVLSAFALVAIVATGKYPRGIFDFNVGVLRWTWRVQYYAFGALGTDRYPPFTLSDVADYPAHLDVEYPAHLSRGLALVKWWLLAIPHYLIVGMLVGGGWWVSRSGVYGGGLIALLVVIAGFALAFTGTYPAGLYDLVLGLNRWVLRVVAYAGLMTDEYPPFRIDNGGSEREHIIKVPPPDVPTEPRPWSAGRVIGVVAGSLLLVTSLGLFAGGGALLWADRFSRDDAGFVTSGSERFTTSTYAIATDKMELQDSWVPRKLFDDVRIRVTGTGERAVFLGVARTSDVNAYLGATAHATLTDWDGSRTTESSGDAPDGLPSSRSFWVEQASGTGTQVVTWQVTDGDWTIVAMNADGTQTVDVRADIAARAPDLGAIAAGLLGVGLVVFVGGAALVVTMSRRRRAS